MDLEIIYQDDYIVSINKPHGLLVHKSKIAHDVKVFALQTLRNQINKQVYPAHRLDRKTSGILLFALDKNSLANIREQFDKKQVAKTYKALVRGWTPDAFTIDKPLINEKGKEQEALTHFRTIEKYEKPWQIGKFSTSRYSLLEVKPETGRMHQIRKHLNHFRHPIIGDRPHGCNKQNKFFLEKFEFNTMLLHAESLVIKHPKTNNLIKIKAEKFEAFNWMLEQMRT